MDFYGAAMKLSPIGLAVFLPGVLVGFLAPVLASKAVPDHREKAEKILRYAGLAAAILGALILVDVIPV